MRRSMLFLPGNTPKMIMNGADFDADAVIFDLEDSVAFTEKDAARILMRNALKMIDYKACQVIIRINSVDVKYWQDDLKEVMPLKPDCVILPKVNKAEDIAVVDEFMAKLENANRFPVNKVGLIAQIETALGVENAFEIARAAKRVEGLFLGAEDLTADLHCKRTKMGNEIYYARARLVYAARAAGIEVYDTPFTDVNDDEGIITDAEYARSLGFTGKSSISPRHVPVINKVFSPSEEEIAYANEVMEAISTAAAEGRSVIALHGKMIDKPVVMRAEQIIAIADELGL